MLNGRGRFETIAQDESRFHLRQSSLSEVTLATYILAAAGVVTLLVLMGMDALHRPSILWLMVVSAPALAFWTLRRSADLVVDRTLDRITLCVRRAVFLENRIEIPLSHLAAIDVRSAPGLSVDAQGPSRSVTLIDREGTTIPVAVDVPPGVADRIARQIGVLAGLCTGASAPEAARAQSSTVPSAPPTEVTPVGGPGLPAGSLIRAITVEGRLEVDYPTRSLPGALAIGTVSLVTLVLGGLAVIVAGGVVWHAGASVGRLLMLALAVVMVAIGMATLQAAAALLMGGERFEADGEHLSLTATLAGITTSSRRWPWSAVQAVRPEEGLKIFVSEDLPVLAAGTLSQRECDWLAAALWARRPPAALRASGEVFQPPAHVLDGQII